MILRTLLLLCLFAAGAVAAQSQVRPPTSNDPIGADRRSPGTPLNNPLGSPEDEMRARMEIKVSEKDREENLERAREVAQLGTEIQQSFSTNKVLSSSDMKKLDRLEKLARRIRSKAGGSDDDEPLENVPTQLETALKRLVETSEALRKGVEKTPRMVVSAGVIERSNELLEIIRYVRANVR